MRGLRSIAAEPLWRGRHGSFWNWVGRLADLASLAQVILAFADVAAVMTWAASDIRLIADYGWGAIVFASAGAACILSLVISFGLVAWRIAKPLQPLAPATNTPTAQQFAKIEFKTLPSKAFNPDITFEVVISVIEAAKDAAFIGRYVKAIHYLG